MKLGNILNLELKNKIKVVKCGRRWNRVSVCVVGVGEYREMNFVCLGFK